MGTKGKRDILDWLTKVVDEVLRDIVRGLMSWLLGEMVRE